MVKGLGDGVMSTFPSAVDAVSSAVEMQHAVVRLNRRRRGEAVAIRVGLSAGDVVWEDDDCFGEPVIEAARLSAVAEGGQVLCSDIVHTLARRRGDHRFEEVGTLE